MMLSNNLRRVFLSTVILKKTTVRYLLCRCPK